MTANQRKAILALLATPSVPAAARAAGLSRLTLHRWLRNPAFQAEFERHRDSEFCLVLQEIQAGSGRALEVLFIGLSHRNRRTRLKTVSTAFRLAFNGRPDLLGGFGVSFADDPRP